MTGTATMAQPKEPERDGRTPLVRVGGRVAGSKRLWMSRLSLSLIIRPQRVTSGHVAHGLEGVGVSV